GQEPEAVRKAEQQLSDLQLQDAKLVLAVPHNTRMAEERRADEDLLRSEVERQRGTASERLAAADQVIYRQLADDRYDLSAELAQALASQDADEHALSGAVQRLALLVSLKASLEDLEGRVANARNLYNSYAAKLADRRVTAALDRRGIANLRVLEEPTTPATPVGLRPAAKIVIARVLGLLAGIGVGADARHPGARAATGIPFVRPSDPLPGQPHRSA